MGDRADPRLLQPAGRRAGSPSCCAGCRCRPCGGAPVDVETPRRPDAALSLQQHLRKDASCSRRNISIRRSSSCSKVARSRGFTFVDVGANIGGYSLFVAAHAGPRPRILAVEPQPDVFDRLTYNIRQNPFGTVKAVACAVADKAGEVTLFLDARNRGESSVKIVGD